MTSDYEYDINKRPDKTYVSKRLPDGERIASKVIDGKEGCRVLRNGGEVTLRRTPAGRKEIKATFAEDNNHVRVLTIQQFDGRSGRPHDRFHFSFVNEEIPTLIGFLESIRRMSFLDDRRVNIEDKDLRVIPVSDADLRHALVGKRELLAELARTEIDHRDIVALAYRRDQLKRFDKLMNDDGYFKDERARLGKTEEALWQAFFESNTWIFGYGLSYVFLSNLVGKKLEQVVRGFSIDSRGKRVDGLLKTQALISSLCFVEIKRHDTPLLQSKPYRPGVWSPSTELVGGELNSMRRSPAPCLSSVISCDRQARLVIRPERTFSTYSRVPSSLLAASPKCRSNTEPMPRNTAHLNDSREIPFRPRS